MTKPISIDEPLKALEHHLDEVERFLRTVEMFYADGSRYTAYDPLAKHLASMRHLITHLSNVQFHNDDLADSQTPLPDLSRKDWNVLSYALKHYATRLEVTDHERPYTGPLETAADVWDLGRRIDALRPVSKR